MSTGNYGRDGNPTLTYIQVYALCQNRCHLVLNGMEVTHGAIQCAISESGIKEVITTGESVCLVLSQGIQPIGSYDLRLESEDETGYLRGRRGGGGEQEPPVGREAHPVARIRKDSGGTEGYAEPKFLDTKRVGVYE